MVDVRRAGQNGWLLASQLDVGTGVRGTRAGRGAIEHLHVSGENTA